MPFSGGGGGQLTAHVHDNTPLQGGPLNFNNTTVSGMNSGDLTYSDGAALQQLAIAAPDDQLRVSAGNIPEWFTPAAGGALYEKIGETVLGAAAASIDVTFAAVNQTDISKIVAVFNGQKDTTNTTLYMKVNSLAANYDGALMQQASAPPTGYGYTAATLGWTVHTNNAGDEFLLCASVTCNTVSGHIQSQVESVTENHTMLSRGINTTAAQTSITKIEFNPSAGLLDTGTILSVYKILL